MIETELKVFLALLKAGILGDMPNFSSIDVPAEQWNVRRLAELTVLHDVVLSVCSALEGTQFPALQQLKGMLRTQHAQSAAKAINQDCEGQALLDAFEQAEIDCIPLKGWVMRQFYAEPLTRCMSDLDILVRNYRYQDICSVLEKLGFEGKGPSNWKHDEFRKPPFVHLELHKRLTDSSGAVRQWEAGVWDRAIPDEGTKHRFSMAPEDFYVFHLVHMYKDFKNGALGFRRLADLWILGRRIAPESLTAARTKLEELHMGLFTCRMEHLAQVCFSHAEADENSQLLLEFASSGAVFTDDDRYKLGRMASQSGAGAEQAKLHSVLRALFLPYDRMKAQFPIVERWPVLLPFFWAKRIMRYARKPRANLRRLDYRGIREEQYERMRRVFLAGGLISEKNGNTEVV